MFLQYLLTTIACGAVLSTGLASGAQTANFTHTAYVPANADISTIHFEKARVVLVPTGMRTTSDPGYCAQAAARDPGGSSFCPSVRPEARVSAWEVTYSFTAPAAVWDETGQTRSEFQVFYRPEELAPQIQKALSRGRRNWSETAEYFVVKAHRETVLTRVVDEAQTSFCEGSFLEGAWVHSDAKCADKIAWKTIASSPYFTVSVETAPAALFASRR